MDSMLGKLKTSQIAVIILAVATALIHFSRAAADPEIRVLFILNGLGYLALTGMLYLPATQLVAQRRRVRWVLIGYASVTIVLYGLWVMMSGDWTIPLGPIDKIIEVALIVLLWRDRAS